MEGKPYGIARFRKALIHFVGGRAVQAAGRAMLLLVLVRLLDVADYGAYMLVIGLAETMLQVASLGILQVGQRYLPQLLTTVAPAKLFAFVRTLMILQLGALSLLVLLLWQFWPQLTPHIGFTPEQTLATQAAVSLFLLIPAFRFSVELLDALLEQGRAQIARALMPLARLAGIGLLLLSSVEVSLANVLLVDICVTAMCLLLSWLFLGHSLEQLQAQGVDGEIPVAEILRFGRHMAVTGLMGAAGSPGALRIVIANALGIAESGLFSFLQSLQRLVGRYLPGTLLRGLIRPVLVARMAETGGMATLQAGVGLLIKANTLMVAAGGVFIAAGGNALVEWLSGGKFTEAGLTLLLMFIALAITSQRTILEMLMQITGHTEILRATSFISPVSLAAVWLLAGNGLNTAVVVMALAAALANWLAIYGLNRATGNFRPDWRGLSAVLLPAASALLVSLLLRNYLPAPAMILASLSLFGLLVWLTKPFSRAELQLVERSIGSSAGRVFRWFTTL
jgi:O-antigen/teichoic acid export membrane protein